MKETDFLLVVALAAAVIAFCLILASVRGRQKSRMEEAAFRETEEEETARMPEPAPEPPEKPVDTAFPEEKEEDPALPDPRLHVIFQEETPPPRFTSPMAGSLTGSLAGGAGEKQWLCPICETENSGAVRCCPVCGWEKAL